MNIKSTIASVLLAVSLTSCGIAPASAQSNNIVFERLTEQCPGSLKILDGQTVKEFKNYALTVSKVFVPASESAKLNYPDFKGVTKYTYRLTSSSPQTPLVMREFSGDTNVSLWEQTYPATMLINEELWSGGTKISNIMIYMPQLRSSNSDYKRPMSSYILGLSSSGYKDALFSGNNAITAQSSAVLQSWQNASNSKNLIPQSCSDFSNPRKAYASVFREINGNRILIEYVRNRIEIYNRYSPQWAEASFYEYGTKTVSKVITEMKAALMAGGLGQQFAEQSAAGLSQLIPPGRGLDPDDDTASTAESSDASSASDDESSNVAHDASPN